MSAHSPSFDLTWHERPMRELVRLAWPIAISMLSFSLMSVVDAFIVSHLGAAALAGVGLGSVFAFVLLCFPLGLLRAAKTLASQAIGAGRREELAHLRGAVLAAAIGAGALIVLAGQLAAPLLATVSSDAAAAAAAQSYLTIRVLGAPLVLVYRGLRELLYADGDTRTPMVATVAANVLNAALAAVLVYRFEFGVAGAAAATVVAHGLEAGMLVAALVRRRAAIRRPLVRHVSELVRLGIPSGLQFLLEVGSFFLLTLILQRASHIEAAAHQVALQVNHLAFLPALALSESAAVLVGQAIGAGRDELVRGIARKAALVATAYTGFCALVAVAFGAQIVSLFAADDGSGPALIAAATPLMAIQAAFLVFDGVNVVARGVLGGAGDVRFPAVVGIVTAWCMTPPTAWFLGLHLGYGAAGGWLGLCGEIMIGSMILARRVETGGWRPAAALARANLAAANGDQENASKRSEAA